MAHMTGHPGYGACYRHHETLAKMAKDGATLEAIGRAIGTTKRHVSAYIRKFAVQRPAWRSPPPGSTSKMARNTGGALNPQWKGGRMLDKDGYVLIHMPRHHEANRHGYVREHRLVMEQKLCRRLTRKEVVHHLNSVRSDNRRENLELFASNGEHLRHELRGVPCPARSNRYGSTPRGKGTGGQPLKGKTAQRRASLGRASRSP